MGSVWPACGILNIRTSCSLGVVSTHQWAPGMHAVKELEGTCCNVVKHPSVRSSDALWQSWWWAGML